MAILIFDQISEPLEQRLAVGLSQISLALRSQAWKSADKQGLTPTQGQILAWLSSRLGEPASLSAVADALRISHPTASDAVAALVRKGLIEKHQAKDDRRAIALKLSQAGKREAKLVGAWPEFLAEALHDLSPDELEAFYAALIKIIRNLQNRGLIAVSRMCVTCRYFRPNVYDDSNTPHHCVLVDAPFGDRHLRIECPEHKIAVGEN